VIPLTDAQEHVLGRLTPGAVTATPRNDSLGLVTAEAIESQENIPPFANTAMDGFALRAEDVAAITPGNPAELRVVGTIAAGATGDMDVGPGQAARIMTGAPIPPGADAIVMVELTQLAADEQTVSVVESVPVGNHIRAAGEDMQPGQVVFEPGTELRPGHLGVLCTLGIESIATHGRPRVGVISTGDELVDGPQPLQRGQIRDSNRRTLLSMVAQTGAEPVDLGLIRDDEAAIEAGLVAGAESCDALITSGGVSMGDFDYVKMVLKRIADMRWMQIAIKPAKPMAFGLLGDTPVFGLPGNPVSSMVSFELFARPGIRKMMGFGADALHRPRLVGVAAEPLRRRSDGKTHFARVEADWDAPAGAWSIRSAGGQGSHQLSAMAAANALAAIPDGDGLAVGDRAEIILFG